MRFDRNTRWRALWTIAAALLLYTACDSQPIAPSCLITSVTVTATPSTVKTGVNSTLTAAVAMNSTCGGRVLWSVTPAGGTLTTDNLTATFSATTPNTFTIKATSVDDATKSGTATVNVTP